VPVGRVQYQGPAGVGSTSGNTGTAGAIGRRWLGLMQAPAAVPQSTPDQDLAFAQAFGLPGAPPVDVAGPPMPPPAGIEGAPPMQGQQFAQAVPPMHPRGQMRGPPVPMSKPQPQPQQQQAAQGPPPSRMGQAGGAALQYLANQIGQQQGPLF
jgi:hypothetical protein